MDYATVVESVRKLGLVELVEEVGARTACDVVRSIVGSDEQARELVLAAVSVKAGLVVGSRAYLALRRVVEAQLIENEQPGGAGGLTEAREAVGVTAAGASHVLSEAGGGVGGSGVVGSEVVGPVDRGAAVSEVLLSDDGDAASVIVVRRGSESESVGSGSVGTSVAGEGVVMPASGFASGAVSVVVGDGGFSCYRQEDKLNRVHGPGAVEVEANAARVVALRKWLRRAGVYLPKSAMADLALASCAGACVPAAFERGRDALRVLELIGDCALSLLDAKVCYAEGIEVGQAQARRSVRFSNARMSAAFARSGMMQFCLYPGGVDVGTSKVGANFVEAIAGVISLHVPHAMGVVKYVGMLKLHT